MANDVHPRARASRRAVWAALTKRPAASIRELETTTGYVRDTVVAALIDLERLGYIEQHGARARRVLVPLVERRNA